LVEKYLWEFHGIPVLKGITPDRSVNEFMIVEHGPDAESLAATYVDLIQQWDSQHRHRHNTTVLVYPHSTTDEPVPPGRVITKRHTKTLISWPASS
jgi:protein-L-isoaspartate(D-aspartate) O-methyltransferase